MENLKGFDWDEGNRDKNWITHKVSTTECEEVFFNLPLLFRDDIEHSQSETRYFVLGRTHSNRYLFVSFTQRQNNIRVISARDMNKKERKLYEKAYTEI
ncbi:MAG: BrnT family toxin [SAR324 cluster bacterium]|nr:BrnT family toxin [SAR324 cluster bacterium]